MAVAFVSGSFVAYDDPSSGGSGGWNHPSTGAADNALAVGIQFGDGASPTVTALTVNAVSATHVVSSGGAGTTSHQTELWVATGVPSGSIAVAYTLSGAAETNGTSVELSGVDQTTPVRDSAGTNVINDPTVTVDSEVDDLVVDFVAANGGAPTEDASQTEIHVSAASDAWGSSYKAGASPSVTMLWDILNNFCSLVAASFQPPSGGGTPDPTDVSFAAAAPLPQLAAVVDRTVPEFAASFAGTTSLPSLAASVDHAPPEFGVAFAATAPAPTLTATVGHAPPQFAASFAATSPLPSLEAVVNRTVPEFAASFAGSAPLPQLTAVVGVVAPGLNVSFAGTAPLPSLAASVTRTLPGRTIGFVASAPLPTLAAVVDRTVPEFDVAFGGTAPLPALAAGLFHGDYLAPPYLTGTLTVRPVLSGSRTIRPALTGARSVSPALSGTLTLEPS